VTRTTKQTSDKYLEDCLANVQTSSLFKLWSNPHLVTSLHIDISKNVVLHKHEQTPKRDTMVACIRGDGIKLPVFWIDTRRSKKLPNGIVQPAMKCMNVVIFNERVN
jgi:hypothetical protein